MFFSWLSYSTVTHRTGRLPWCQDSSLLTVSQSFRDQDGTLAVPVELCLDIRLELSDLYLVNISLREGLRILERTTPSSFQVTWGNMTSR